MTDRFGPGQPCRECGGDYGAHTDTCPMTTPHAPEGEIASLIGLVDDLVAAAFDAGRSADDDASPAVHCATVKSALLAALSGRADQAQPGAVERYIPDRHADPVMRQASGGSWMRYTDHLNAIAAARAEGATAERQRLANGTSEEDRGMVEALESALAVYTEGRLSDPGAYPEMPEQVAWHRGMTEAADLVAKARATVLAALTARRAAALEEAAKVCAPAMTRLKVLVRALDRGGEAAWTAEAHAIYCELSNALLPRGPGAATGTGVG